MNMLRLVIGCVVVIGLAAGARGEKKEAKKDNAKLLLGSWEATKADPNTLPVGAVVEFGMKGKMKVTGKKNGKEETHEATYKVDGDKITISMNEGKFTITIKKISEKELVTANDKGDMVEFKRKK